MTINIRQQVFETNSSSSHSITIAKNNDVLETIIPDEDGNIHLKGGQFGWEWTQIKDPLIKANYCAVDQWENKDRIEMLKQVLKEHTGAKEIIFDISEGYTGSPQINGYIDHDSLGTTSSVFKNLETLRNFIFNPQSVIFTGNNNETSPPNFYNVDHSKVFTYKLSVEGTDDVFYFSKKPKPKELEDAFFSILQSHKLSSNNYNYYPNKGFHIIYNDVDKNKNIISTFSRLKENIVILYRSKYICKENGYSYTMVTSFRELSFKLQKGKFSITENNYKYLRK